MRDLAAAGKVRLIRTAAEIVTPSPRTVPGAILALEGAHPIGEDPDKRDYIVSNERIEGTGFKPQFSLEQGIGELIKGYRIITNSVYGNV